MIRRQPMGLADVPAARTGWRDPPTAEEEGGPASATAASLGALMALAFQAGFDRRALLTGRRILAAATSSAQAEDVHGRWRTATRSRSSPGTRSCMRLLPCQGCHRILMIFRGHPAVEREPQPAPLMPCCPAAPGALRPRRQCIPASARRLTFQATPADSLTAHRPTLQLQARQIQGRTSPQYGLAAPGRQTAPTANAPAIRSAPRHAGNHPQPHSYPPAPRLTGDNTQLPRRRVHELPSAACRVCADSASGRSQSRSIQIAQICTQLRPSATQPLASRTKTVDPGEWEGSGQGGLGLGKGNKPYSEHRDSGAMRLPVAGDCRR
jgi:hypothetical protein